jgi:pantoate--beta-alanine ligase
VTARPDATALPDPGARPSLTVLDRRDTFRKALDAERAGGRTVGLVPTMGALHAGHLELLTRAAAECDVPVLTVFVNPLQFGPSEDLAAYPRDLAGDAAKAEQAGAAYLFCPGSQEMFPEAPLTSVRVAALSDTLEGARRPGHFDGVATIVAKLFGLAGPCRAYFGEKDFQQLSVVRRLVRDLSAPVDVVGCPTVRDADGLALSSRNAYLTPDERAVAPTLCRALLAGRALIEDDGQTNPDVVRAVMTATVAAEPQFTLDYAEVVSASDLTPMSPLSGEVRLLIAAQLGRARLIDNMGARI